MIFINGRYKDEFSNSQRRKAYLRGGRRVIRQAERHWNRKRVDHGIKCKTVLKVIDLFQIWAGEDADAQLLRYAA